MNDTPLLAHPLARRHYTPYLPSLIVFTVEFKSYLPIAYCSTSQIQGYRKHSFHLNFIVVSSIVSIFIVTLHCVQLVAVSFTSNRQMDGIGHVKAKKTHIRINRNENLRFLKDEYKIMKERNCSFRNLKRCGLQTHSKLMANIRKQTVKQRCF
jgi:hypothetical protein